MIAVCGNAGSDAPWRPWDDGGHHGWWVHGLASFTYQIHTSPDQQLIDKAKPAAHQR
jgi:hypothetical protein